MKKNLFWFIGVLLVMGFVLVVLNSCGSSPGANQRNTAAQAEAHYNQGNAHYEKMDYDKAIMEYTEAIRLRPDYAEAYNGLGLAHKEKGDYDKAITDYTEAIRIRPDYAEAYYNRGTKCLILKSNFRRGRLI